MQYSTRLQLGTHLMTCRFGNLALAAIGLVATLRVRLGQINAVSNLRIKILQRPSLMKSQNPPPIILTVK